MHMADLFMDFLLSVSSQSVALIFKLITSGWELTDATELLWNTLQNIYCHLELKLLPLYCCFVWLYDGKGFSVQCGCYRKTELI